MNWLARAETILVISADNPADVPSRLTHPVHHGREEEYFDGELRRREDRLRTALTAAARGWCWGSEKLEAWCAKFRDLEGMRHCDPGGCDERFLDSDDELESTADFEVELPWAPDEAAS